LGLSEPVLSNDSLERCSPVLGDFVPFLARDLADQQREPRPNGASGDHAKLTVVAVRKDDDRERLVARARQRSRATSPRGRAQQVSASPAAGGVSG
jgi:hypothetical protein